MPIQIISPAWRVRSAGTSRGGAREAIDLPGLPPEFLTDESRVAEEVVLEAPPATRGRAEESAALDLTYDLEPGQTAILAVRHRSQALTFHLPVQSTSRGSRTPAQVRFQVTVRQRAATRGPISQAIKAIVVKVGEIAIDKAVSFVLPKLVDALEKALWRKRGLKEGWLKVTRDSLAAGTLEPGRPVSPNRSLLFIHGTFSNAASAYRDLAKSTFFDRVADTYGDRMFAFDHFSLSRTPEENARMLLEGLPEQTTTFDVVTHSRGGLVLRNLVERATQFGALSRRFRLGRAVLVASPNDGTPLATPKRWDDTIGWIANLLELFPDNPFTVGPEFVANGLVWLANHASGDVPGLRSMDGDGAMIAAIQSPPGPAPDAYSALVANYHPTDTILHRLLDVGLDQFFGSANDLVVPSEGGWRIDRSQTAFIPATRIGCFGPGGNLSLDSVTHVSFFSHAATVDFLVNALGGRQHALNGVDPRKSLPDRRLVRGAVADGVVVSPAARAEVPAPRRAPAPPLSGEGKPLRITVTNGDLTFEPEALLIGHYRATRLTGTERVMDDLLGGTMEHALNIGLYPSSVGSHQVFINTRPALERGSVLPRPKAVIVVGLGEEGKLQSAQLARTVRQAVIAWAQRLGENKTAPLAFELAATLLGSGGPGVTAGEAARLVARGVSEANERLADPRDGHRRWPQVSHLHLIELYLDRATDAWRSLRLQDAATPGRYEIGVEVKPGTGGLQRPPESGYRGADYDFISVETREAKDGAPLIAYTLDTRRARSEVRGQRTQSQLLRELVATASNDHNRDEQIGRTLFNLLIPIELEAYLVGSGDVQIELDPGTARIPWELLMTTGDDDADRRPWAIRTKLLRKLRVEGFRDRVTDADAEASVLVIGEPECPKEYPRLLGARAEAVAVNACLTGPGALESTRVKALISADPSKVGSDARAIVNALFEQPWRIVHIAGHGALPEDGAPGGVVLSNGSFLGSNEISNMRAVPELVFVNCCHLASGDPAQLLNPGYDRANFASGVAGALINIGVRCVIAAGWAVDDEAAGIFAEAFYGSLLRGNRFIDAVGEAREAAYTQSPHSNTWAAYQCYGDPDWVFRRKAPDADQFTPSVEDFSSVASATTLKLTLERIVVRTKFQGADPTEQRLNVQQLEKQFGEKWGRSGSVAELFAEGFVEVGAIESGMHWYERAVAATDGRASMKAAEQLANVSARLGWENVDKALRYRDEMRRRANAKPQTRQSLAAARRALVDAEKRLREASGPGRRLIEKSLGLLQKLRTVERTMERESLVGSAYKRRALIDSVAGNRRRVEQDLRQMKASYERARAIGRTSGEKDLYYPALNCLVAEVALNAGRRGWRRPDPENLEIVRRSLQAKRGGGDEDFWSVVGAIELRQYEALAEKQLTSERRPLERAYQDLHKRVKATRMWASVYDTACLVLQNYGDRASRREKEAADALLALVRTFAHPEEER